MVRYSGIRNRGDMDILKQIQNIIPDSKWKTRSNYNDMTTCYTGRCPGMHIKIIETPSKFSVNIKSNLNTYSATYCDSDQLLDDLPMILNSLDS